MNKYWNWRKYSTFLCKILVKVPFIKFNYGDNLKWHNSFMGICFPFLLEVVSHLWWNWHKCICEEHYIMAGHAFVVAKEVFIIETAIFWHYENDSMMRNSSFGLNSTVSMFNCSISYCDPQNLQYKTHSEFWPSHNQIFKTVSILRHA